MVDTVFNSSKDLNEIEKNLSHSAKEDIRKVKKNQFSFKITSDNKKLNMFYYYMYLPTLKKIIGETEVFTPNYLLFKYLSEIGYELMLVTHDEKDVCGVYFYHHNNVLFLKYAGVFQGDISLIKKGALSAAYYFSIILAKDRKVRRIDFGGTRPFFKDGLFIYKKKWGMIIEPYLSVQDVFGLKILNDSEPIKQFLIDNPFIGINDKSKMVGYIFFRKDRNSYKQINYNKRRFDLPGITELKFIPL
jgi:hypothetical protein